MLVKGATEIALLKEHELLMTVDTWVTIILLDLPAAFDNISFFGFIFTS